MARVWPRFLLAVVVVALVGQPRTVQAHPLGNFTINLYSRLTIGRDQIDIVYILDMAEIPAYQEAAMLSGDLTEQQIQEAYLSSKASELVRGVQLQLDQQPLDLAIVDQRLTLPPGQGGLLTLRIELQLSAPMPALNGPRQISYSDTNYADRLGWREIVVQPATGVDIQSTVSAIDVSSELHAYPTDMLSNPLNVRSASIQAMPGTSVVQPRQATAPAGGGQTDRFAALLATTSLSPIAMLLLLLTAFGLGALHALAPGHGKTIVAAYLVGSRGTARHAVYLGMTVTITHTAGVFLLGLITLSASRYILPETLFPWLSVISGMLVAIMGFMLARQRLLSLWRGSRGSSHEHSASSVHEHGPNTHTHLPPAERLRGRSIVALGIAGGILPCPSALVVLLGAISLGRVGLGLALIVAFSIGLAGVLTAVGLLMLYGTRLVGRVRGRLRSTRLSTSLAVAPLASAVIVLIIGVVMTARALIQAGVVR